MGTGERRKREKSLRRQQIQESAKKIFLLKGFRSATIEDIANEAELSTGTIYQYYRSKDELYASMNLEDLQYMTNKAEVIYKDQRLAPETKILKIKEAMYETFLNDPLLLRIIFHVQLEDTLATLNKNLLKELNDLGQKMMRFISLVYEEGVEAGKFTKSNSMVHADIMWGTFAGLVMWEEAKRRINPKKDFLKPTLDRAFDIFISGLKKG